MKKKIILSILILLISSAVFTSCKKAKEEFKKDLLSRTWKMSVYKKNDIDQTALFNSVYVNYLIGFNDQGNFSQTYTFLGAPVGISGTYIFENNEQQIRLTDTSGKVTLFSINELSSSKLTVTVFGTDKEQFFLIPK